MNYNIIIILLVYLFVGANCNNLRSLWWKMEKEELRIGCIMSFTSKAVTMGLYVVIL